MQENRLEELCRPIVSKLCVYWQMANAGEALDVETVEFNLRSLLSSIKEQVSEDPSLKRGFSKIERPLVFFIDYTIREGHFPFKQDWHELSYDYNELSGDEKFFDLLAESLDDPDTSEQLYMYYLFLGLGFDGCQTDHEYIERRMKVCATRFNIGFNPSKDLLSDKNILKPVKILKKDDNLFLKAKSILLISILLSILALVINVGYYYLHTRNVLDLSYKVYDTFHENLGEQESIPIK